MRRNDYSNNIFKWVVEIGDFVLLNLIIYAFFRWHWRMGSWGPGMVEIFILASNAALLLSQIKFPTIIHLRLGGGGHHQETDLADQLSGVAGIPADQGLRL